MTDPAVPSSEDPTSLPAEELDAGAAERPAVERSDVGTTPSENAPHPLPSVGPRRHRRRSRPRRLPALIVAAVLVGAGVFLALRGMQQVVARAPATPIPAAITSPAPTSNQGPPSPTPQPTPMPTSSALILEP